MSEPRGMIEHMFDTRIHDDWAPPDTAASRALLDALATASRQENRAAAQRLRAVADLFAMRRRERGENEDWAVDTWAAVGAEVAAALRISLARAGSYLRWGLALSGLPAVAALFVAGDIDLDTFRTIVYRTELVTDAPTLAEVDRRLAARVSRWPSMTRGRLIREIDRIVASYDLDAVRRTRDRTRDRDVTVWHNGDGLSDVSGRLTSADAMVLDRRLDALAGTVCPADPRTAAQRRADALGALAAGAQRLMCRCETADCPAIGGPVPAPVVIHVVAERTALDGDSDAPGYLMDADTLISADLLRELAATARRRPLVHPGDCPAEPGYRPSRALADFVRARDLTCRAPGCDAPATACDIDHTVPHADGGPTHASNCKLLCRVHHLLKTFWGWRDEQLPDGTVIWRLPDGETYVTTPGGALLFPMLMQPTKGPPIRSPRCPAGQVDRRARMPLRTTTRKHNRAQRIAAERARNHRLGRSPAARLPWEVILNGHWPARPDDPAPF